MVLNVRTDYEYRLSYVRFYKNLTALTNITIFIYFRQVLLYSLPKLLYISNATNTLKSLLRQRFFQLTLNLYFSIAPFALN